MLLKIANNYKSHFIIRKFFSTQQLVPYPDEIIVRIKDLIKKVVHEEDQWIEVQKEVVDKINFFDADQYVDTVCLFAYANKGTETFWDLLSKKIYDYDIDLPQTEAMKAALANTTRQDYQIYQPLIENSITHENKFPEKKWKLFKQLYYH
jgi:hypothetical protein